MKRKIKVCHLTSVHTRFDVRIFHKECISLAENGFDVSLIVADGLPDEIIDGVKIFGVKKELSRIKRILKSTKRVYKKAVELNADIYHFHDPELMYFGLRLQKKKTAKVIYDIHEDLPRQIKSKHYLSTIVKIIISKLTEFFENHAAKRFDLLITSTPYIKDRFIKLNSNTININNYPIVKEFSIDEIDSTPKKNEIAYIGGISEIRGIMELIDAISNLDVTLNLAGHYQPIDFKSVLKSNKAWGKVIDHGYVNREQIKQILKKSKIGIVTLHPTINYLDSLPVKMFEYMASGLPVIASNFPLWKEIIEKNNCGLCVNPKSPKEIRKALKIILNDDERAHEMGNNGKKIIKEKYNWEKEAIKMNSYYKKIIVSK